VISWTHDCIIQMDRSDGCLLEKANQEDFRPPTQTTVCDNGTRSLPSYGSLESTLCPPQARFTSCVRGFPSLVRHGVSHLDMASISISQHPIIMSSTASNSTGVWTRNSTIVGTWYLVSPPPPARPHSPLPPRRLGCLFVPSTSTGTGSSTTIGRRSCLEVQDVIATDQYIAQETSKLSINEFFGPFEV
jgi:hypothetical protein